MSNNMYDKSYYDNYDVGTGKVNYADAKETKSFLTNIAKEIVEKYNPKTVLEMGCAFGHLVGALRDLGVEAYGIDISEYAISQSRDDIKKYLKAQSATDDIPHEFPAQYDLVITIEMIEHLYEEDGLMVIKQLCKYSNQVLLCTTPDDYEDETHFNVQQPEYWAKHFAKQKFYVDEGRAPAFLTPYALFLYKNEDFTRVIEDYERNNRFKKKEKDQLNGIIHERNLANVELQNIVVSLQSEIHDVRSRAEEISCKMEVSVEEVKQLKADLEDCKENLRDKECTLEFTQSHLGELRRSLENSQQNIESMQQVILEKENALQDAIYRYEEISNAFFWRITKPLRLCVDIFSKVRFIRLSVSGLKSLKNYGLHETIENMKLRSFIKDFSLTLGKNNISFEEAEEQWKTKFSEKITFSIVVPLYNTPEEFLIEMIDTVRAQTYDNWELCLADGSDNEHGYVGEICRKISRKDKRIKYKKLVENLGISENTNACIEMSSGDYIGLFDHDDLLHPSALYYYMKEICDKNADFIYCDEQTFEGEFHNVTVVHYKPDFAIDNLRANNYICHFTVFKRSLLDQVGMFRKEFDGSQDYDLILRLVEKASTIVHVPQVLYFWRAHQNSVASDISAKTYTIDAAKKAISEHLERCGLTGKVVDSKALSWYKVQYDIIGEPKVSILIPNKDSIEVLKQCIESIVNKTTYKNYEIVIVENNSESKEIFEYYEELEKDDRITVVKWEHEFNYSKINNYGIDYCKGEHIVLLNNDIEVITPEWIEEMLMYAQRDDVGAVGAMLYYPNDTIQHAGVILGIGGVAGHSHKYFCRSQLGYMGRLQQAQNLTAVTAACMMVKASVVINLGGLDEEFAVAFNDIDFCMRIREAGYLNCWTPFAELYHHESITRGQEDTPEKIERFQGEIQRFHARWKKELEQGDPYYNKNLTLDYEDFRVKE